MLEEPRVKDAGEVDPLFNWFHGRFWPELVRIHKQAATIVTLIAEQQPEPPGLSDALIDPQPLLRELARLPGTGANLLGMQMHAYLTAWQTIRRVAITQRPVRNGAQLFDVMMNAACFFADMSLTAPRAQAGRLH